MNLSSHSHPIPRRAVKGFTLIELMVTLSLIAILATLAIPSFVETLRDWRRDSATRALTADLQLARSESIKSSRQVVVCPSTNGTACAGNNQFATGWVVFVDNNADQTVDADDRILKVGTAPSGIASMTGTANVNSLIFLPNGLLGSAASNILVTPSGANASTTLKQIAINRVGRAQVSTTN